MCWWKNFENPFPIIRLCTSRSFMPIFWKCPKNFMKCKISKIGHISNRVFVHVLIAKKKPETVIANVNMGWLPYIHTKFGQVSNLLLKYFSVSTMNDVHGHKNFVWTSGLSISPKQPICQFTMILSCLFLSNLVQDSKSTLVALATRQTGGSTKFFVVAYIVPCVAPSVFL